MVFDALGTILYIRMSKIRQFVFWPSNGVEFEQGFICYENAYSKRTFPGKKVATYFYRERRNRDEFENQGLV